MSGTTLIVSGGGIKTALVCAIASKEVLSPTDITLLHYNHGQAANSKEWQATQTLADYYGCTATCIDVVGLPMQWALFKWTTLMFMALTYAQMHQYKIVYTGICAQQPHIPESECNESNLHALQSLLSNIQPVRDSFGLRNRRLEVEHPLLKLTAAECVRYGTTLEVPFQHTYTCDEGKGLHCGKCLHCLIRQDSFRRANVPDPATYVCPNYVDYFRRERSALTLDN